MQYLNYKSRHEIWLQFAKNEELWFVNVHVLWAWSVTQLRLNKIFLFSCLWTSVCLLKEMKLGSPFRWCEVNFFKIFTVSRIPENFSTLTIKLSIAIIAFDSEPPKFHWIHYLETTILHRRRENKILWLEFFFIKFKI